MVASSIVEEVRRLLAEGRLSQRKIARAVGISRGTVAGIASGQRPDYTALRARREDPLEPAGPPARCPGCGGMVYLPCRLCHVKSLAAVSPKRPPLLGDRPIKEITGLFTAVGFSSPPSWARPYRVLSNGEQFRCDLAPALGVVVLGLTLDAADLRGSECQDSDIPVRLYMFRDVRWTPVRTVGQGETYRARGEDGELATVLVVDDTLVHLSMTVPKQEKSGCSATTS